MHNTSNMARAKELRRNMTREERHLWYDCLLKFPVHWYRQKPMGKYIVDFYCPKLHLVVELDGSQHYMDHGMAYDANRTKELSAYGVKVLRIPNNELMNNFDGVCRYLYGLLECQSINNPD